MCDLLGLQYWTLYRYTPRHQPPREEVKSMSNSHTCVNKVLSAKRHKIGTCRFKARLAHLHPDYFQLLALYSQTIPSSQL